MKIYKDQNRSFEERAVDLVSRMTLEEKVMQVGNSAAAIPRLDIPAYDYWGEADGCDILSRVSGDESVMGSREDEGYCKKDIR